MEHVFIIAEAGVNHNGDLALARQLVDAATAAGADAVKFQTFVADQLVTKTADRAAYQKQNMGGDETQYAMLKRLELTHDMHRALIQYCAERHIRFLSTPFSIASAELLRDLGLTTWKIPSGEITNLPFLRFIGSLCQDVILSTGMADHAEVQAACDVLVAAGTSKNRITVLHCHTEYPTEMRDVHLRAMGTLRDQLGVRVGYSDHTLGIEVPIAAAALGATVIEKHLTLDRTMAGPDHKASLEPDEFATMVTAIRRVTEALGSHEKKPTEREIPLRAVARKSIVAARPIRAGEILTEENITVKRPGTGVSPMQWDAVLGQRAVRDFDTDDLITL